MNDSLLRKVKNAGMSRSNGDLTVSDHEPALQPRMRFFYLFINTNGTFTYL